MTVSYELHPVFMWQKKSEGTAVIPTQKSATASETRNALVLVRSCRLLQTRKITNPFPPVVRAERDQPRIQTQVFIIRHRVVYVLGIDELHPGLEKRKADV